MTTRRLAVVTAGLSQPSSTRLLADRLADATRRSLQRRGLGAGFDVVELRAYARELTDNVLTGFHRRAFATCSTPSRRQMV